MGDEYLEIRKFVLQVIENYIKENEIKIDFIDETTRLIGSSSSFDSMDLVQIIVDVEDKINKAYNCEIILTDEKAMSRSTSPFINVSTLTNFILENINKV
jgi:acyl carrier protein